MRREQLQPHLGAVEASHLAADLVQDVAAVADASDVSLQVQSSNGVSSLQ